MDRDSFLRAIRPALRIPCRIIIPFAVQSMRKSDLPDEFTNISDEEEDEIHIIQQPKDLKPPVKRKKE